MEVDISKSDSINQLKLVCQLKIGIDRFVQHFKQQHNLIEPIHQLKSNADKLELKSAFETFCKEFNKQNLQSANAKLIESNIYDQVWDLFVGSDNSDNSVDLVPSIQLSLIYKLKQYIDLFVRHLERQNSFVEQIFILKLNFDNEDVNLQWKVSAFETFSREYDKYLEYSKPKLVISNIYDKLWDLFLSYDNVDNAVTIPDFDQFLKDIVDINYSELEASNQDYLLYTSSKLFVDTFDMIGQYSENNQVDHVNSKVESTNNSETVRELDCNGSSLVANNHPQSSNQSNHSQQQQQEQNETKLKCDFKHCDFGTGESSLLDHHTTLPNILRLYKCNISDCTFATRNKSDLIRHKFYRHSGQQK